MSLKIACLHGPPGCGKSSAIYHAFGDKACHVQWGSKMTVPQGAQVVVFDMPPTTPDQLFDAGLKMPQHVRVVVVESILPPSHWFPNEQPEIQSAVCAMFDEVIDGTTILEEVKAELAAMRD